MRQVNCLILSGADTGNVNGSQIDSNQLINASFQAVFGDSNAAGTIKIQMSNDVAPLQYSKGNNSTFTVTNWSDIPNASSTVTAGVAAPITLTGMAFRWIRAVYVRGGSGATTVVVNMFAQGI
jgi:hypothetical protein